MESGNKVIVILGTTASGKTKLAVDLAKKFNGEIISADSRQVYQGLDVGTGKDLAEYGEVPYYLIDVVKPETQFSLAQYQKLAYQKIKEILGRGKVPIICGGTGLYISAVVDGYVLSTAKPDQKLRQRLAKMPLPQLLAELKKVDPETHKIIDAANRRRVERALEIFYQSSRPKSQQIKKRKPPYEFLILGLTFPREILKERINQRLKQRLEKEGMVDEVKKLHQQGLSWRRLDNFGLEYRWVSRYLRDEISYPALVDGLQKAIADFAKRQMTWFKREKKIVWLKTTEEAERLVKKFLD